jgi:hypothetical protein
LWHDSSVRFCSTRSIVGRKGCFQRAEVHAEKEELLLDTIVQVAFDSATCVV